MKTVEWSFDLDVVEPVTALRRKKPLERFILVAECRVRGGGWDGARRLSGGQILEHPPGLIASAQKSVDAGDPPSGAWSITLLIRRQRLRVQAHLVVDLADTDGNPNTAPDVDWQPLVNTPCHPEYPAGHPGQNGAAATVLLSHFDDEQTFTLTTIGQPNRTYTSITQARSDGNNARVWGGMHYPSTVEISDTAGEAIANYVNQHSMQRLRGGQ
jgi:hypothetical protein